MKTVNQWWESLPHERFWLAVGNFEDNRGVLEIPDEDPSDVASWVSDLPAYLAPRDVVFHYNPATEAIAAWSRAQGPAHRQEPGWSLGGAHGTSERRRRPRWVVKLRGRRPLDQPVPIDEIARVQWNLFPSLRALEERHGDPLYYPFAMGNPQETHPLPGRLFKLPALFVDQFSPLTSVAGETRPSGHARPQRRAASWWEALDSFLADRPKAVTRVR